MCATVAEKRVDTDWTVGYLGGVMKMQARTTQHHHHHTNPCLRWCD
jgi:hypothetical protein